MSGRRARVGALLAAMTASVAAGVTACGVPPEDSARPVEPPAGMQASWAAQSPPARESGTVPVRLFLVRDDKLVPVTRHVRTEPDVAELVDDLLAGPTESEQDSGLTSALLGGDIIVDARLADGIAVVELADGLDETSRTDQVLAFAQIVCTLTANSRVAGVSFIRDGQVVGVPRANGSLSEGPLTASDYAELLAPR
jgi:spore germination protein GerM